MSRYPQPGAVLLGKYRIDALIGEGGMGAVLKAHHLDLDEPVAIKVLLPEMMERKDIVSRFQREAKAAVKLKGEHVARVLDIGRLENAVPFIVMEYLDGADLGEIVKHHGRQDPAIAVDLILQACEALAEAHALGIVHRDVKASNLFVVQPDGQAPMLKVLDFGIATAPEGTSDLTGTGSVVGTPAYMAPEQMRAAMKVDARSDIWSLGVVLYELLEAARPFRSEVYSELVLKVGMDPPHVMENPAVPAGLRAIVMRCLEKDMDRRYQTVAELAIELMPFASDAVQARATVEQVARLLRRTTKAFPVPQVDLDSGPIARPTPTPFPAAVPTAGLQRTPTSAASRGELEVAPNLRPRAHAVWFGLFVVAAAALGGAAFYYVRYYRTPAPAAASAPADVPAPPPAPPAVLDYDPRAGEPEVAPPPPPDAAPPVKPAPKKRGARAVPADR